MAAAPLLLVSKLFRRPSVKTMLGMAGKQQTPYYSPYSIGYWLRSEAKNLANRKSGRLNKHVTKLTVYDIPPCVWASTPRYSRFRNNAK